MADDSVVDDDESKTVTNFLLNTCRLLQPTEYHVLAAVLCDCLVATQHNDDCDFIPLTTGSVAEFYIQPMLSCVGDVDIMVHRSDQLAILDGYPPPSQLPAEFHSRVKVFEIIDSEYPGYVYLVLSYLLTENTDDDKYGVVQCNMRQYMSHDASLNKIQFQGPTHSILGGQNPSHVTTEIHGPAETTYSSSTYVKADRVFCMRCLSWPTQAGEWQTRHRNYNWPDSATVDHVVSNGCDVVGVAHRLCRQDEWMGKHQWRLSFTRAEIVLLNSWMPVQQIVYHMLRVFVKTERLTDITDSNGTKMLSNYHIKTLMLWACELKPRSWWTDDLNVVRICADILHILDNWFKNKYCPHYFVKNGNIIDTPVDVEIIISHLTASATESWLSMWFVNNYLRKCAQLCSGRVSRLFDDVSMSMKLQNAVSAVVDWRLNSALEDIRRIWILAELSFVHHRYSLTVRSCDYRIYALEKIDSCFCIYFTAVAFLHVAYKTTKNSLNDKLLDVLATIVGQLVGKRRPSKQLNSKLSLSQAAKLMKVVVNNSRSTEQLIEIELSKAYLYRALRCKDSHSDSIYCLANIYLAVLYYSTGQYQTAIYHCTLVMRSQDHSQCSSHVVQGEILPKIDDDIHTVLGLSAFYQYVRTAALNQQQTQHVSVFTTELFAHYLHIRCLSVVKCRQLAEMSSTDEVQRYIKSILDCELPFIADVLSLKSMKVLAPRHHYKPLTECRQKLATNASELDTSELVELLQQSALERLTTYRQLWAQKFGSDTIVTTDFEALYAYKRGDYRQCLQLSTQNVRTLLYGWCTASVLTFPEFIQLFDDEFTSLTALILIAHNNIRRNSACSIISQLTLSLYLMTQCQLKLHHSLTSLAQTLDYIEVAQRRHPVYRTLDHLTLKLTERKAMIYLSWFM